MYCKDVLLSESCLHLILLFFGGSGAHKIFQLMSELWSTLWPRLWQGCQHWKVVGRYLSREDCNLTKNFALGLLERLLRLPGRGINRMVGRHYILIWHRHILVSDNGLSWQMTNICGSCEFKTSWYVRYFLPQLWVRTPSSPGSVLSQRV